MDSGTVAGWPRNRWELSAAESYVLLYGPKPSKPSQPFKLAVLELASRRVLRLVEVEKSGFLGTKRVAVLTNGDGTTDNQVLSQVRDLYLTCERSTFENGVTGVEVKSLAQRAGRHYGSQKGFAEAVVIEALARQGFYRREERRILGIIPYQGWKLTPQGEVARAELAAMKDLGEARFGAWVDREPNRALAYLGLAGPAILLMEPLHLDLQRLREEREFTGDSGGFVGGSGDGGSSGEGVPGSGEFDLDFGDLDFDFDALSDLGGVFDAIDAGVDAGGGGGGDGGGGGGNGGGG